MKSIRYHRNKLLLFLIVAVSFFKITLVNQGFLAFPDEDRYRASGQVLKRLAEGDLHTAIQFLFSTKGRPGDTVVKVLPTIGQYISAQIFGMEIYESKNAFPVFIYNYIIYSLLLLLHYKVSLYYLKDRFLSLFSVLILSTMVVSYISLRHADPYDGSLVILYYVFYKIIKTENAAISYKKTFLLGVLAFFGYLCYPGYILLFLSLPFFCFVTEKDAAYRFSGFKRMVVFISGSLGCLLIFEGISRCGGVSFIEISMRLSGTITQGSFDECFSFIFKYLFEAEGAVGLFLTAGLCTFVGIVVWDLMRHRKLRIPDIYVTFVILCFFFLAYSAMGYYFHKVVWYARLIKQFIPFIVIFTVYAVQRFKMRHSVVTAVVLGLSINLSVGCCLKIQEYKRYVYPKDMAWDCFNQYRFKKAMEVFEYGKSRSFMPNFAINKKKFPEPNAPELVFINSGGFYPFDDMKDYRKYRNQDNYKLLKSGPSCLHFKAYQYEGYNIRARKNIDAADLQVQVYVRNVK
ncbi:hypothetical protein [Flavobacterium sp.]|uniref:hypothetical protein n=1 Tax=Flavobacterium sp. TaxID=239 RepID=UPI002621C572|nr:hypothetical protein [Flavobacterium sp.]